MYAPPRTCHAWSRQCHAENVVIICTLLTGQCKQGSTTCPATCSHCPNSLSQRRINLTRCSCMVRSVTHKSRAAVAWSALSHTNLTGRGDCLYHTPTPAWPHCELQVTTAAEIYSFPIMIHSMFEVEEPCRPPCARAPGTCGACGTHHSTPLHRAPITAAATFPPMPTPSRVPWPRRTRGPPAARRAPTPAPPCSGPA